MIAKFVERFEAKKADLEKALATTQPNDYSDLVRRVIVAVSGDETDTPDPARIHEINDGKYQGTLLFVVGAKGSYPTKYWYVFVDYGSCSGCDTFEAIRSYSNEKPNEQQIQDYMSLMLHLVQGIKELGET